MATTTLPTATWTTIGPGDMSRAHSASGALGSSPVMGASPVSTLNPLTSEVAEVVAVQPGSFDVNAHFYPRVLNAQMHPIVRTFLNLGNERIAKRYCHLHPEAVPKHVHEALQKAMKTFLWAGADIFVCTSELGHRKSVVIETNSCPSGQKSQPQAHETSEKLVQQVPAHCCAESYMLKVVQQCGYRILLEASFMPALAAKEAAGKLPRGALAVLYDKNKMEASGYAAALADLTGEQVFLVPFGDNKPAALRRARFTPEGVLEVRTDLALQADDEDEDARSYTSVESVTRSSSDGIEGAPLNGGAHGDVWMPIRAALRYVTHKPWSRIPALTRTFMYNPVLACLAGGRNKMLAAKAYDCYNADLSGTGLAINVPETIWNVPRAEVPLWVRRMGGHAVVKVPYANAGMGVWTIVNEEELQAFMNTPQHYTSFIVQALIGNSQWSSRTSAGPKLYHVGTIPNAKGNIHAFDLRMMIGSGPGGFFPVAIYARRARKALPESLLPGVCSWDILGTNLSIKMEDGGWRTQTERLLLMDSRDFNVVGIGLDDIIEAYMQTVLAVTAIDRLCDSLISERTGRFCHKLFQSLNPDPKLLEELYILPAVEEMPAAKETPNGDSHPGINLQHISISA